MVLGKEYIVLLGGREGQEGPKKDYVRGKYNVGNFHTKIFGLINLIRNVRL